MKKSILLLSFVLVLLSLTVIAGTYPDTYYANAKTFMGYLSSENFSAAQEMFNQQMKKDLPLQKLETLWNTVKAQAGEFSGIEKMGIAKSGEYIVVVVNVKFQHAYLDFKLVFDSSLKIAGLWITQAKTPKYELPSYVDLSAFTVKKIEIGQKWKLPAELTIPKGKGPFPAVVLIPGSGPSDMNETIGVNEPFKDIAYGLSTMGIAVLRYDKRAHVYAKEIKDINVQNIYLQDASYAIEYMLKEPNVSKVFVLGHSLGAYLLPEIAKENPQVAGLIMLAPPARDLAHVMVDQLEYILKLSPNSADEIEKILDKLKLIEEHKLNANEFVMGAPASYYYELEKYDPISILKTLSKPVLICQGGKDYQVTAKDYNMFKNAFQSNSLFTFKWYPNLSHIFTPVSGVPSPANYQTASNVSQEVIEELADWIQRHL